MGDKTISEAGKEVVNKGFWEHLLNQFMDFIFALGTKVIYAALAIVVGLVIIKLIKGLVRRIMDRYHTEASLRTFIMSLSTFVLWALLLFIVGLIIGVKASSFLAIFGAIGLAIGLALQGSLANFAGGVLVLVFKPFKIGDEVVIQGIQGEVLSINILYTTLHDWRGQHYTMPNGTVANNVMANYTAEKYRRVQVELRFSHDEDIDELRDIITSAMKQNPDAIQEKPFQFWISNFQDYYIKTSARCWCKSSDYWGVYWAQEEAIKKALEKHNIKLAIPKQENYDGNLKQGQAEDKSNKDEKSDS